VKSGNLLNPALSAAIASLGHTEYLVIADAGLPIPKGVEVIDLSLCRGVPAFLDAVKTVLAELVVESYIYASELPEQNSSVYTELQRNLAGIPGKAVPHTDFKRLVQSSRVVVRTGECSPYANVILVGGVNF
jgi:D-ribose pyranase